MKNTGHMQHSQKNTFFMNAYCSFRQTEARKEKDKCIIITMFPLECDHSLVNRFYTGNVHVLSSYLMFCLSETQWKRTDTFIWNWNWRSEVWTISMPSGTRKLWGSTKTPNNNRDNPSSKQIQSLLTTTYLTWGGKYRLHIHWPSTCCCVLSDVFLWNILIYGPIRQLPCKDV